MATFIKTAEPIEADKALSAMLAVLVADREDRLAASPNGKDMRKTELVLATSGLSAGEIAPLLGKNVEAVRKTLQRGKDK